MRRVRRAFGLPDLSACTVDGRALVIVGVIVVASLLAVNGYALGAFLLIMFLMMAIL